MKNKTTYIITLILAFSVGNVYSQNIKITKQPHNIDAFLTLRNVIATTPEGGAAIFLQALKIYVKNPKLGKKCLVISVHKSLLKEGKTYKGFKLASSDMDLIKRNIENNKLIPNSYILGSAPKNNYKVELPYEYEFSSNILGKTKDGTKVFVKCSGSDTKRYLILKKNNRGLWKVTTWTSVLANIQEPPDDDDL
ncbi:MAG: hypothetical protein B6I20_07145 [Bacteroidetes bacterium 4572_117]|nr:MAG: hypothetical protein B6I20_07145 [Bacteroidetes bacterium 4572_117]